MPSMKAGAAGPPIGGDVTFGCAGVTDGDEVGALRGGCGSALTMYDCAGDLGAIDAGATGSATEAVGLLSTPYAVYISTLEHR